MIVLFKKLGFGLGEDCLEKSGRFRRGCVVWVVGEVGLFRENQLQRKSKIKRHRFERVNDANKMDSNESPH